MRIKVLFVAPYAAMVNLIEECHKDEQELDLQIKVGNLYEGVELAKRAESQGFDVIISRGGTAKLIGEAVEIPVIDVHVSGYDMLRVLTLANDFPRKKAIVGFSNITLGAKAIIDILDISIDIFTIESGSETEPLLQQLKREGYDLIMGDVVTFETVSQIGGILGILIQSGREAIIDAFKEAKTVSRWLKKGKRETDQLKAVLKVIAPDCMVMSESGEVVYEQWINFPNRPLKDDQIASRHDVEDKIMTHVAVYQGEPLKVVITKIFVNNSSYLIHEVFRIKRNSSLNEKLEISEVSTPVIIHQSKVMKLCLTLINRCRSFTKFILFGKRGTAKEYIAKYIHYQKFSINGLFASIKACDLVDVSPDMVDTDIKTFYIHSMEQVDDKAKDGLLEKIKTLHAMGITIILDMVNEQTTWGNIIYRDDIIHIPIPALKERQEDIRELVTAFIVHYHQTFGTSAIKIKEDGLALLEEYGWPGDVEELKALLKNAVLMEKGYVIEKELIEGLLNRKKFIGEQVQSNIFTGSLEEIEKKIIEYVLKEENFNQTKTANRLNINRATLWRKLKK